MRLPQGLGWRWPRAGRRGIVPGVSLGVEGSWSKQHTIIRAAALLSPLSAQQGPVPAIQGPLHGGARKVEVLFDQ